ncbi:hypothetical protein PMIN07_012563 [Paraphaeosphaeria minitans]
MASVKSMRSVGVPDKSSEVTTSTANANTLPELIATIPRTFQPVLGDRLTKLFRIAQKHANVMSTITIYERHSTDKSFPPLIRNSLKEPKLQFAKEFLGTTDGHSTPEAFAQCVTAARASVLKQAIEAKRKERDHLATLLRFDLSEWQNAVHNVAVQVTESVGGRVRPGPDNTVAYTGIPKTADSERLLMSGAGEIYTFRCIALAKAAIDRAEIQKLSKLKLKDNTDTEMKDVNADKPVRDIIREEIASLKKELSKKQTNSTKPANQKGKKPKGNKVANGGVRKQSKKRKSR